MKNITPLIIEFLSHPELGFGTEEDALLLEDPEALRERVTSLLDEYPSLLGPDEAAELKARLDDVAWSFVALELQARIEAASNFDTDANATDDFSANGLP